jgi:hypothetical protein
MILGDDSVLEKEEPINAVLGYPLSEVSPPTEVPPKELFRSNLKNLNGYR